MESKKQFQCLLGIVLRATLLVSLLVAVRTTGLQIPPVQSNVVPAVDPQSPPSSSPALQAEISELSQSPPSSPPQSSEQPSGAPPPIAVTNISNPVPDHTEEPHHETELPSTQPPNAQQSEGGRLLEEMIMAIGVRHTCKCDTYCTVMGDCCPDYFSVCASAPSTAQILSLILRNSQAASADDVNENDYELWIASQYLKYGSCREATFIHNDILEVSDMWMIATCPESFTDYYGGAIAEQCESEARNKLFSYPVSHRWFPHLVYKNIFCAMCHDVRVEDILFWHVVVYCPVERKEFAEDYSYQDVLDAADNHFCFHRQGAKLPYHAAFRTCKSGDSNIDGHAYVSGCSPDGPGEDSVFTTHRPDFSLGCANTFQPIGIQSRNTTYSSVHCALCNGLTVHDLPPYLPCVEIRSPPGRLQPEYTAFAKVWYDQGTIAYTINGLKNSYGTLCSTHVPLDPRTALVGHCPTLSCPPDIQFFEDLSPWEMSCAIENMKYRGEYWNDFPHRSNGDLLLIISKHIENIILPIAHELWFYTDAFANIFDLQCPYECYPPHQFFHSLSLDTDGNFQARYRHRGSLHYFFAFMKAVDTTMFQFHGGRTSVRNYAEKSEVCPSQDDMLIELFDIPLFMHNFDVYAYVGSENGCFFRLENIGFSLSFNALDGPPRMADTIVLCWRPDMAVMCKIPPQSTDNLVPRINKVACNPELVSQEESTQEPSQNINRMNRLVSNGSSHMDSNDQVILKETKSFKTVCFTISAVSSALSGVFNVALCCQQLTMILLFTVSKLSLAASMIFYTVNIHITDGDEKVMAIFMHFCWLLTAASVTAAAKYFNIPTNQASNGARGSPKKNAIRWVMGVVIFCVVLVGLCVIVDENYDSNESVGYSSHSGHLFWMSHETGCYIFSVGIIGACYLAVTLKLAVGAIRYLRTRGQSEGSSTDAKSYGNKRQGARELGSFCMLYLVHLIALYLLAVIDYTDKNYATSRFVLQQYSCNRVNYEIKSIPLLWSSHAISLRMNHALITGQEPAMKDFCPILGHFTPTQPCYSGQRENMFIITWKMINNFAM
ncbi:hypothetical protein PoB_001694400 [Plakobranchus ocellatus]|uniref:SMB domain-containing protein n=1 Tax=Plakobranchus ocellatus TaxID=259542 RepID=A0AAV3Z7S9_9GAST|nr:hypothetical protein PoB_001694400 [Plakobranchus ocellatus]